MRRRVSKLETDKATSDQRHAGVMKRAADETRRGPITGGAFSHLRGARLHADRLVLRPVLLGDDVT